MSDYTRKPHKATIKEILHDDKLVNDACLIIEQAKISAYHIVNDIILKRNWLLGMRIQHEILGEQRAGYGEQVIKNLSQALTIKYGRGYKKSNLYSFVSFYQSHPKFFQSVIGKTQATPDTGDIFQSVIGKLNATTSIIELPDEENIYSSLQPTHPIRLSWTHYNIILQEPNEAARAWYENEATNEMWSTRTLQRNISSQYYHRLLQSQNKELVHDEMVKLTAPLQDKLEYLKNPIVAEFLGFKSNTNSPKVPWSRVS